MRGKSGKERQARDAGEAGSPRSQAGGKSIVFADNDALVLEALGELLRGRGYEVHLAHDGIEALRLIRNVRPSYVILDIVMPNMDGSRVCALIRQDPALRDIPVIAFSSLSAQNFRQFPELSADAYVAKGHLSAAFENVLEAMTYVDEAKGKPGCFAGGAFGYDSLRPRQLIDEMLQERRHYANVLHALGDGVLELDRDGRILMASVGACEFFGRAESEIIGENLDDLLPDRLRESIRDLLSELAKMDRPERYRTALKMGTVEASVQFCAIIEDNQCNGILVILDKDGSKVKLCK